MNRENSLLNNLLLVLVLLVGIEEIVVVLVLMIGVNVEFKVVAIIVESESLKKKLHQTFWAISSLTIRFIDKP